MFLFAKLNFPAAPPRPLFRLSSSLLMDLLVHAVSFHLCSLLLDRQDEEDSPAGLSREETNIRITKIPKIRMSDAEIPAALAVTDSQLDQISSCSRSVSPLNIFSVHPPPHQASSSSSLQLIQYRTSLSVLVGVQSMNLNETTQWTSEARRPPRPTVIRSQQQQVVATAAAAAASMPRKLQRAAEGGHPSSVCTPL